jgi:hypothetical protein
MSGLMHRSKQSRAHVSGKLAGRSDIYDSKD